MRQGSQFFEAHSTGKLMSSIMNDIEKIQVATSHILADLLRQGSVHAAQEYTGMLDVIGSEVRRHLSAAAAALADARA